MKKSLKYFLMICIVFIVGSLGLIWQYGANFNVYIMPPSPKKYGEIGLKQIDQLGLYTNTKKWQQEKEKISDELQDVRSYKEARKPLEEALAVAGGKHSFISKEQNNKKQLLLPKTRVENGVLIITIPEFSGTLEEGKKYGEIITESLYHSTYDGIILDFRGNGGGDMGVMLSGLSPLLPDGDLLYFVDKDNNETAVTLKNGKILNAGTSIELENQKKVTSKPIAILMNQKTGSSGELTILCFEKNNMVKTFGEATASYTSANKQITLYDGITMQITSEKVKDTNNKLYENQSIQPDEESSKPLEDAIDWLTNQN